VRLVSVKFSLNTVLHLLFPITRWRIRLTSRRLLWLDLQPAAIKSRWRHNWKSTQVVNCHLVCDPTIRQPGFYLPRQQWSLLNRYHTEQRHCAGSVCRRKWRLTDTDLCLTLSNSVPWQNWMMAYLGYTLQMKTLFHGWLVMVYDKHTRRRRRLDELSKA